MDRFPPLQRDGDERDVDRSRDTCIRSDLNGAFYAGLHRQAKLARATVLVLAAE
jgi:hypothetical protein